MVKLALHNGFDKKAVICTMNILLIAATEAEIAPLTKHITAGWQTVSKGVFRTRAVHIKICITGVGMVATTYNLTKELAANTYDFVIQAGIAGTFDRNIELGKVVYVNSEQFADLGAEDHDKYLDVFELGLANKNEAPFSSGVLYTVMSPVYEYIDLPEVNGITVNTTSGNDESINRLKERYYCETESMEGAAFHFVCLNEQIPFVQLRAISNYIEPRDKSKWQIKTAIENLNLWLINFLEKLKIPN